MLEACPRCANRFTSPYVRFCGTCGLELSLRVWSRRNEELL